MTGGTLRSHEAIREFFMICNDCTGPIPQALAHKSLTVLSITVISRSTSTNF